MAIEVKLPELGDGIESGDVLDVLIAEGDTIQKDQSICELETDKATVEIPSSHGGKVVKIHIASGDNIPIGSPLITLESEVVSETPPVGTPPVASASDPLPAPAMNIAEPAHEPLSASPAARTSAPSANRPDSRESDQSEPTHDNDTGGEVAPAGPAIRRLAREVGIDLNGIRGSGAGGRITRDDVLVAVRKTSQPKILTPPRNETASKPSPTQTADTPRESPPSPPPSSAASTSGSDDAWGPVRVERMPKIRKTIARKMYESWSTVPRVTNFDDADVTELESIRTASKPDYRARGLKLTSMAFVIKAVAMSLRNNSTINASLDVDTDQIIYKHYVNIGIAVDTERGLVVPSLRKPDQLGIPEIARALESIAHSVRENNFKIEDLRGSTFTISNLGAIGGSYSTPIINVPEVAILLLGRTRKMPVVIGDSIEPRLMMPLSLSYDHRVVDGAEAARFLNDVKGYLEQPSRLLIAP